jgi:hypothetical protein
MPHVWKRRFFGGFRLTVIGPADRDYCDDDVLRMETRTTPFLTLALSVMRDPASPFRVQEAAELKRTLFSVCESARPARRWLAGSPNGRSRNALRSGSEMIRRALLDCGFP